MHKAETPARASGKDGNFSADDGKPKKEDKIMMTIKLNDEIFKELHILKKSE